MKTEDLGDRTKKFSLRIIQFFQTLPKNAVAQTLGNQLLRAVTSVGSNYRASRRARSRAEFISKLSIVVEEADESVFWLELIKESSSYSGAFPEDLMQEAKELTYIFSSSRKTAKENLKRF